MTKEEFRRNILTMKATRRREQISQAKKDESMMDSYKKEVVEKAMKRKHNKHLD